LKEAFGDITKFASRFSAATIASRVVGLGRDVMFAAWFGTGMAADAFNVAFLIPNLLRRVVGEGATQSAVVPIYADTLAHEGSEEAGRFARRLTAVSLVVLVAVAVVGVLLASPIVRLYALGWRDQPEKLALTIRLTRILFPFVVFAGLTAVVSSYLNTHQRFTLPALAPAVLNVCFVACALGLAPVFGPRPEDRIYGFTVGALVGGLLMWLMLVPQLRSVGASGIGPVDFKDRRIRLVGKLLVPGFFGLAVTQVNMFVDTLLATLLPEGSVTALRLANRLMLLPLGIFGVAVASASLPTLSGMAARKDYGAVARTYAFSLRLILFTLIPATVGLIVLRTPIVRVIYERGAFTADRSTPLTAGVLLYYSLGLFAYGTVKGSNQVFFALKDTRTPVIVGAVAMVMNVVLNLILMRSMGVNGLALATSISAAANVGILMGLIHRRLGTLDAGPLFDGLWRIVAAAAVMGVCCHAVAWGLARRLPHGVLWAQVATVGVAVGVGLAVYLAVARALRVEALGVVGEMLRSRRGGGGRT
jgi:putative peptidoglycan lipid II flippase